MEKSSKEFPWANIWMMAFAVIGIRLLWPRGGNPGTFWSIWALWPLVGIFVLGFLRMPAGLYYDSDGGQRTTLNDMARLYLGALTQVFRQRWMLGLLGSVLALVLLGTIVGLATQPARPRDDVLRSTPIDRSSVTFVPAQALKEAVSSAPDDFLPSIHVTRTAMHTAVLALALIALLAWLAAYSRRVADDPQQSDRASFFRAAAPPIVIVLAAVAVATPIAWFRYLAGIEQWRAAGAGIPPSGMLMTVLALGGGFCALLMDALLVSGILGSLARTGRSQSVTFGSFLSDIVRYFRPMAGFFLLWVAVGLMIFGLMSVSGNDNQGLMRFAWNAGIAVQWLSVLLMFVPSAVVLRDIGAFRAIRTGVRHWFANWSDALSFVALGITFISTVGALGRVPEQIARWYSQPQSLGWTAFGYASPIVQTAFTLLITAVMMVAIWEFYRRITPDASVTAVSAVAEPGI